MTTITVNGKQLSLDEARPSISSLLSKQGYDGKIVAVAHNGKFLPKNAYALTFIQSGDDIEIVAPMQGG